MSGVPPVSPVILDSTLLQGFRLRGGPTLNEMHQLSDSATALVVSSTQSGNYTYQATDHGTLVEYNSSSAGTFTVPANVFQVNTVLGFRSVGTGQLTIAAGAGFTLQVPSTLGLTPPQWTTGFIHIRASNVGVLM